ncbi:MULTISPECIES: hypothetical protein [unclassified Siphonobacter]|uniref:hypothetical protein n=1 Tax=unclassified Siphonobacter TaxID=2635712 RepID=UPI00278A1061|nr:MULTISPECIES: hypothetical protein [unclassified Siphonobacter]MDQ1086250.1 hypothetical protein [Siphonobacter sp. SORGH_AS_1065]MDR6196533.1 hypothetical protein [Siphonobacter sp. SORGH_AS_0500]
MKKKLVKTKEEYLKHLLALSGTYEKAWPGHQVPEWLPLPKPHHYPCIAISTDAICQGSNLLFDIELVYFTDFLSFN